jgi:hypothetical protein
LVEHWDGSSWTTATSPNVSNAYNSLSGGACVSDGTCWAVGSSGNGSGMIQTLIEMYTPPLPSPTPTPTPTATPTPVPSVATPVISPNSGTFKKKNQVSISCATSGATIYYTTDGSNPTTGSEVYANAFTISGKGSHSVKAKAVESGYTDSDIAAATFVIN